MRKKISILGLFFVFFLLMFVKVESADQNKQTLTDEQRVKTIEAVSAILMYIDYTVCPHVNKSVQKGYLFCEWLDADGKKNYISLQKCLAYAKKIAVNSEYNSSKAYMDAIIGYCVKEFNL